MAKRMTAMTASDDETSVTRRLVLYKRSSLSNKVTCKDSYGQSYTKIQVHHAGKPVRKTKRRVKNAEKLMYATLQQPDNVYSS